MLLPFPPVRVSGAKIPGGSDDHRPIASTSTSLSIEVWFSCGQERARSCSKSFEHPLLLPERSKTQVIGEPFEVVVAGIAHRHSFIVATSSDVRAGSRLSIARLSTQSAARMR